MFVLLIEDSAYTAHTKSTAIKGGKEAKNILQFVKYWERFRSWNICIAWELFVNWIRRKTAALAKDPLWMMCCSLRNHTIQYYYIIDHHIYFCYLDTMISIQVILNAEFCKYFYIYKKNISAFLHTNSMLYYIVFWNSS